MVPPRAGVNRQFFNTFVEEPEKPEYFSPHANPSYVARRFPRDSR